MRLKAWCRIIAVALLALPLIPLQWLAVRFGWKIAYSLPVFFHRRVLAIIGVKLIVTGRRDERSPLLITANHVSWLDIVVLGSLTPLSFIAKSEVAGWPVIGLFARLQRSVFIERERRQKVSQANAAISARLRAGDAMLLFAEGTTGDGIHILPFRSALLGAAREATPSDGLPTYVQPLALRYIRRDGLPISSSAMRGQIAWIGDMDLAPHLFAVLSGGPIDVAVRWGEAEIYTENTDRKALAHRLQSAVERLTQSNMPE